MKNILALILAFCVTMAPVLAQSGVSVNSGITIGAPKNPTVDAPPDAAYGVVTPNSSLPNARTLTGGSNISVTDGGAGGNVTFAVSGQIPVTNGGTGASDQQGAANAVLNFPGLTSQDLFYYNGTNIARFPKGAVSTYLQTNGSGNLAWVGGTGGGIDGAAPVLMFGTDPSATASRNVTAGTGISVTDGGALGNATFAIDSTVATLTGSQTLTNKVLTAPTMSYNAGSGFNLAGTTFNSALKWADWAAARNLTIPDPGADASFVMTEGAQTLNGVKTFGSTPVLSTGAFTVGGNTVTVPSATDTLVNLASTQSLSNKTISAPVFTTGYDLKTGSFALQHTWDAPAANRAYVIKDVGGAAHYVMKDTTSAYTAGAIPYGDGSKLVVGSAGTSGQPLLSGGTGAYTFGTLGPTVGGTNQTTYATGDTLYASGANTLAKLAAGTNGHILTLAAGVPTWAANAASTPTLTLSGLGIMTSGAGTLTAAGTTGDLPYFSGTNTTAKLGIGSSGQVLTVASGIPAWKAGPIVNNLRLTLSSSDPDTDTSAASTIYALPYNGNSISIYNGSTWDSLTTSSASIAVPSTQYFRLYNVYCYNNASTPTLELNAWDSGGQTTKTITAATAANPCVITTSAAHGLSVGDLIGIRKGTGTGTGWTDTAMGLDQKVFRVSAVPTTTTIELEGCDASALTFSTFTGTPTVYKIPTSPTTAPVRQNGVLCKTGALTRRLVGTFMTNGAGTVDDSVSARMLSNVDNRVRAVLGSEETTASYTTAAVYVYYPRSNSVALGVTRTHLLNALAQPVALSAIDGITNGCAAVSRNSCFRAGVTDWPSYFLGATTVSPGTATMPITVTPNVPSGFSFFQQLNWGNGTVYNGSAYASTPSMCRMTALIER